MILFLYGADSYRSKKRLEEIIQRYKEIHSSGLNLLFYDTTIKSFEEFWAEFQLTSMFNEKKLFVLKNLFNNNEFQENIIIKSKDLFSSKNIIVVYEDKEVDEKKEIFKVLRKNARCEKFNLLSNIEVKRWLIQELLRQKIVMESGAQTLLLNFVGNDLWRMSNEIEKLKTYKGGKCITREDVISLVGVGFESNIFKTIELLASRNKKDALFLIHKHLEKGENPLYLLSMIAFQFRNLLAVKELLEQNFSYLDIQKKVYLAPFVVRKLFFLSRYFSLLQLKSIYQKIFQIETEIKKGKIEPELALHLLVSQI